jgi:hypothetical protein
MKFYQETTEWEGNTPNHTYLLNDSKDRMVGYVPAATGVLQLFKRPIGFDIRGRKFRVVPNTFGYVEPREEPVVPTWEVRGSKGDVYKVSLENNEYTCTCTGFKFRGHCKHIDSIKGRK